MNVADTVSEVEATGAAFRLEGEKVRIWYPDDGHREKLTEQIAFLRNHRADVAAFLIAGWAGRCSSWWIGSPKSA